MNAAADRSPFEGPDSLRVRGEWAVLWWSLAGIAVGAPLLAWIFPLLASAKEVVLVTIGAMLYVTLARGRLIGGSIRVHAQQFGHVFEIAQECSRALRVTMPAIFVRDDPFVPLVAVGIGEPFSLIISAQYIEHLTPGELRFLIGRELAHVAAGHTRITSLLSINGRENAVVSVLFGAWLRRIEYTADRAGFLCCGSLDDALSAIAVSAFHLVGRRIDLGVFADQQAEIDAERSLRLGEWVASTPYATRRMAALRAFARDGLSLQWAARIERLRHLPVNPGVPAGALPRKAFAGLGRRGIAFGIDLSVVGVLRPALPVHGLSATLHHLPPSIGAALNPALVAVIGQLTSSTALTLTCGLLYAVVLGGLSGQTLGMMIVDVRIVNDRLQRIGLASALARYVCLGASFFIGIGFFKLLGRVQPFERWSRTRLVHTGATVRRRAAVTAAPVSSVGPSLAP